MNKKLYPQKGESKGDWFYRLRFELQPETLRYHSLKYACSFYFVLANDYPNIILKGTGKIRGDYIQRELWQKIRRKVYVLSMGKIKLNL